MHIPSAHNRSELLATPQMVRLDYAKGNSEFEPTLLIKADALVLKNLTQGARIQLMIARVRRNRLLYGLIVHDDPVSPGIIWSVMEREEERQALLALAEGRQLQIFLFNEIAVNVAWAEMFVDFKNGRLKSLAANADLGQFDYSGMSATLEKIFTRLIDGEAIHSTFMHADLPTVPIWNPIQNTLMTNRSGASELDLFDLDEGRQQETLILWLADCLHPSSLIDRPQIMKGGRLRELTDILLSYSGGTFIFESKALALLNRPQLPDRTKLAKNVVASVEKAFKQLKGAARQISEGTEIYDLKKVQQQVERTQPIHAIILVPDLRLLPNEFGIQLMCEFMTVARGYLHLVDPSELLRIVQVTEELVRRSESQTITPMMALDSRFIARAKTCADAKSLNVEIITRFN